MNALRNLKLALVWHQEFRRVRADLATYSPRQLSADLRLNLSDIDDLAKQAADARVATLRHDGDDGWRIRFGQAALPVAAV